MAYSIETESGKWHEPQIDEHLYDVIDNYYPSNITVKLYSGNVSMSLSPEPNVVRLVSPDVTIYDENSNPVISNFNESVINGELTIITSDGTHKFHGKVFLSTEKYKGISINAKNNYTTVCLAKAMYPNIIVFGVKISEIPNYILKIILSALGKYSLISNEEEYKKCFLQYSKENLSQVLLSPHLDKKHLIIKKIYSNNDKIDRLKAELRETEEKSKRLQRELIDICDICDSDISLALKEIEDIKNIKSITWNSGISLFNEGKIQVKTKPIYCVCQRRKYLFGEYLIEFDFINFDVKFINLNTDLRRKSYWGEGCHHPHIDTTGRACLGNIRNDIETALKDMSFSYAVILAVSFLRSVNIKDAAGKYVKNWPVVDEEGNIIYESCDSLVSCCVCSSLFPEDNTDAEADNWAKCDICGGMICPSHISPVHIGDKDMVVCSVCKQTQFTSCEVCGEIFASSDLVTTRFGKNVCSKCCSKIEIIRLVDDNDFMISSSYVTDDELRDKVKKCTVCGYYHIINEYSDELCPYCKNGHSFHTCEECGSVCSDARHIEISQNNEIKKLCMECYNAREYKPCINCLEEYPKSEMHVINSEFDMYQCNNCYEKLLNESGEE